MTKEEVKALIAEKIKTNGKGEISAKILADVLNSVVEACSEKILELDFRNMNLDQIYTVTELIRSGFITEDKVRSIFDGQYDAIKLQFTDGIAIFNLSFCGEDLTYKKPAVYFGGAYDLQDGINTVFWNMDVKDDFNSIKFCVSTH